MSYYPDKPYQGISFIFKLNQWDHIDLADDCPLLIRLDHNAQGDAKYTEEDLSEVAELLNKHHARYVRVSFVNCHEKVMALQLGEFIKKIHTLEKVAVFCTLTTEPENEHFGVFLSELSDSLSTSTAHPSLFVDIRRRPVSTGTFINNNTYSDEYNYVDNRNLSTKIYAKIIRTPFLGAITTGVIGMFHSIFAVTEDNDLVNNPPLAKHTSPPLPCGHLLPMSEKEEEMSSDLPYGNDPAGIEAYLPILLKQRPSVTFDSIVTVYEEADENPSFQNLLG